jgi:SAM-dependent methyltransferase
MELHLGHIKRISPPIPPENIPAHEEYVRFHRGRFWISLDMLQPILSSGSKVLSVGIEPGYFEAYLAIDRRSEMFGTDLPKHQPVGYQYEILFEDSRARKSVKIPVSISEAGRGPLPFLDCNFDLVLFLEVIEHFSYRPQLALSEMHRVLKPGGLLLLSTPSAQHWHRISYLLAGRRYPDAEFGDDPAYRHNQVYSMLELEESLRAAGFSIAQSRYQDCYGLARGDFSACSIVARALSLLPKYRKENIFILAKRTS